MKIMFQKEFPESILKSSQENTGSGVSLQPLALCASFIRRDQFFRILNNNNILQKRCFKLSDVGFLTSKS